MLRPLFASVIKHLVYLDIQLCISNFLYSLQMSVSHVKGYTSTQRHFLNFLTLLVVRVHAKLNSLESNSLIL